MAPYPNPWPRCAFLAGTHIFYCIISYWEESNVFLKSAGFTGFTIFMVLVVIKVIRKPFSPVYCSYHYNIRARLYLIFICKIIDEKFLWDNLDQNDQNPIFYCRFNRMSGHSYRSVSYLSITIKCRMSPISFFGRTPLKYYSYIWLTTARVINPYVYTGKR